jgi:hypothetical protein
MIPINQVVLTDLTSQVTPMILIHLVDLTERFHAPGTSVVGLVANICH